MQSTVTKSDYGPQVHEKVTLITNDGSVTGVFEARIEKIINGGIVITDPDFVRGDSELSEGAAITIQYSKAEKTFQFDSSIKSITIEGGTQVILSPPINIRHVQRRMFVRLGLRREISYAIIAPDMSWLDWEDEVKSETEATTSCQNETLPKRNPCRIETRNI